MKIKPKIHKKFILFLTLILLFVPLTAYAQIGGEAGQTINELLRQLQTGLNVIFQLIQTIFWPILLIIGGLLGNDLLFSSGMEDRLLDVWVEIRNFVNIGFVVILIGIAIYNVSGMVSREELMLKTILPKFVIALILVNFSFIGMKIVLDTTNVLTNAVFAMPSSISTELQYTATFPSSEGVNNNNIQEYVNKLNDKQKENMQRICRNIYGKSTKDFEVKLQEQSVKLNALCTVVNDKYEFTYKGVNYFTRYGSRNAAMIMAIQMMNVIQLDEVSEGLRDGQNISLAKLSFNLIFSVVLYILYGAAYITLLAILLVRIVVLWIVVALSPLLALFLVFKGGAGGLGQYKEKIVDYILAPIWIGIPLTIGYLMLDAYQGTEKTTTVGETFDMLTSTHNLQTSGISTLQELIIAFAAVAVIWVGVFMFAGNKFRIAGFVGEKLRGAGRLVGRAATMAQIIPVGGKKTSLANVMGGFGGLRRWVRKREAELYGGELPELRKVKTKAEFLRRIKPAYKAGTIGEKIVQERVGEMLRRNRRLQREILTPAALTRLKAKQGAEGRKEVIEKLKKGKYSEPEMRRWLEDMGIRNVRGAAPATGAAAAGGGGAGAAAARRAPTEKEHEEQVVKTRLNNADNVGTINGLDETSQGQINKLRKNRKFGQIKETAAYKKLTAASAPADEIDGIQRTSREFSTDNARPLAEALKKYKETIQKSGNISEDEAQEFTDAVLQKHMGTQKEYNQAKGAIKGLAGYDNVLP